ncbi:MAG: ATP-dependent Clp protease adapter ClpS [Actinomycetes bacterium]
MIGPRATTVPVEVDEPVTASRDRTDRPWNVVVWNDPVNLMSYVVLVFQKIFGYSRERATQLMLEVHHEGRSVVASGTREQAEHHVARLHAHGLWATTQRDS